MQHISKQPNVDLSEATITRKHTSVRKGKHEESLPFAIRFKNHGVVEPDDRAFTELECKVNIQASTTLGRYLANLLGAKCTRAIKQEFTHVDFNQRLDRVLKISFFPVSGRNPNLVPWRPPFPTLEYPMRSNFTGTGTRSHQEKLLQKIGFNFADDAKLIACIATLIKSARDLNVNISRKHRADIDNWLPEVHTFSDTLAPYPNFYTLLDTLLFSTVRSAHSSIAINGTGNIVRNSVSDFQEHECIIAAGVAALRNK